MARARWSISPCSIESSTGSRWLRSKAEGEESPARREVAGPSHLSEHLVSGDTNILRKNVMSNIVTFPAPVNIDVNPDDSLEEHAAEIRKGLQDIRRAMSNALDIALAVGQRLNIAKDQVGDGKWSKWLRDDCELSRSSALLYMRLANHQGDIDAARVQLPDLS